MSASPGAFFSETWFDPERSHGLIGPATHHAVSSSLSRAHKGVADEIPVVLAIQSVLFFYSALLSGYSAAS